jgi:hypothetical protein
MIAQSASEKFAEMTPINNVYWSSLFIGVIFPLTASKR